MPARIAADRSGRIGLAWTPWSDRFVPIAEVEPARAAVLARDRDVAAAALRQGLTNGGIATVVAALAWRQAEVLLIALLFALDGAGRAAAAAATLRRLRRDPDEHLRAAATTLRFQWWLGRQRAPATRILVGSIVVAALAQVHAGVAESIAAAGLVKEAVRSHGEWWRLLTCAALHGSVLHLLTNLLALYPLARLIEAIAGRAALALTFVFAVIAGSAASVALVPAPSVGASGGILGLIGFVVALAWRRREAVPPGVAAALVRSLALIAVFGIVGWGFVDNAAHLGGLVGGGLVALALVRVRGALLRGSAATAALGILAALTWLATIVFALARMLAPG